MRNAGLIWIVMALAPACTDANAPTPLAEEIVPKCSKTQRLCDCGCHCTPRYACFTKGIVGQQQCFNFCNTCERQPNCGAPVDMSSSPDLTSAPPDLTSAPADLSSAPTDQSIAPSDSSIAPSDSSVAPSDSSVAPSDSSIAPSDQSIAPSDSSIAPTDMTVNPDLIIGPGDMTVARPRAR
jgi:hypothetical protein